MATDIGTREFWQDPSRPRQAQNTKAPGDDLDDLFDYDAEPNETTAAAAADITMRQKSENGAGDLGIDEEIKVRKARAPIARLDEERLLSANGIPKLRRICKERLRFKGKGHEFTDVARLLNTYQLWLDDLFPKAKFADGLSIIEKLGHKTRMQVYRKEWINEGKPHASVENGSEDDDFVDLTRNEEAHDEGNAVEVAAQPVEEDENDLYTEPPLVGVLAERETASNEAIDAPEEDELDALLAEDDPGQASNPSLLTGSRPAARDNFEDEEEAMAGMEFEW